MNSFSDDTNEFLNTSYADLVKVRVDFVSHTN